METNPDRPFLTTLEASKLLGVSLRTVQLWAENGLLECWKTEGGHRRIPRASVERLLDQRKAPAKPLHPFVKERFPASLAPLRILVVEDDSSLLRLYRLKMAHWALFPLVSTASNGFEALVRIGSWCPDLLIADLHMPNMDGFRMIHSLRSMPELDEMDIVVVSGLDEGEIADRGGVPGDIPVLPKPVPFDALEKIVFSLAEKLGRQTGAAIQTGEVRVSAT